ncbi:uncharacterized protein LOC133783913 [Humulus lupulus]|uniref:uncharacterized protein LOC133783913 n=1 Tax=Humulus lupulus TaxID=3486 RepID=UPI002B40E5B7|nr:uncharacterized protein LOC133783913 [Humulus lupulus]XP_062079491.1 uncharacterized protein LOC133783913 [Humulus lupulus]
MEILKKNLSSNHVHRFMIQHEPILGNAKCGVCKGDISEPYCFYKCDSCIYRYAVHERCHQIDHPFHPSHPLILHTDTDFFICNSCHKRAFDNGYYECAECDFYMDVKCARMPLVTCDDLDQEHIQHFTHQHPMPLINPITRDGFNKENECCACRFPCSGSEPYYGCERCEYFLHKSCAQLPQQIHGASVHKEHPLTLHIANREFLTCTLCKKSHFFSFECGQCSIHFCVNCSTMTQAVMFEYHEHPLYFHERLHSDLVDQCDSYDSYCKNPITRGTEELNHTKSSMLGCVQCNFKLHLLCGPLPSTIKYEYHIHSLLLVDQLWKMTMENTAVIFVKRKGIHDFVLTFVNIASLLLMCTVYLQRL